jgi:hypothetical protein
MHQLLAFLSIILPVKLLPCQPPIGAPAAILYAVFRKERYKIIPAFWA